MRQGRDGGQLEANRTRRLKDPVLLALPKERRWTGGLVAAQHTGRTGFVE